VSWSTPKTFVSGELVTASMLNTYIRDQQNILKTPINDSGSIEFTDATELTIASGVITVTQNYHKVDTQGDAASDDLDTITAGTNVAAGFILHLRVESDARTVVIKNGTGGADNLDVGSDVTLDESYKTYSLVYDGTNWRPFTFSEAESVDQPMVCEGRLTLTSGTPVTTADVTGAGTIYFALYGGNRIALYTGAAWTTVTFAEMSIAASGGTASKPHDIFLDYNGGSPALALLAWTNDTSRATALTKQDGVYVKTGDTQQRYLGSVWLDGSKQIADSEQDRHVWNYYNRTARTLRRVESTNSWTYTTATYRQANGSTANSVNVLVGVDEDTVTVILSSGAYNSGSGVSTEAALGLDSTSAPATNCIRNSVEISAANDYVAFFSNFSGLVGLGRHDIVWLERSGSSGTTTWIGDEGGTVVQSGMQGVMYA